MDYENDQNYKNSETVAIAECLSYKKEEVREAIEKCIYLLGGFQKYKKTFRKILLKPNLLSGANPELAITTHPVFIEAVIDIIRNNFAGFPEIVIADSPGVATPHTKKDLNLLYNNCGLSYLKDKKGVTLSLDEECEIVSNKKGKILKQMPVIKPFLEADLVINLPKFKTHSLTRITGAVKNMYGIIHGRTKTILHTKFMDIENFHDMLLDIYLFSKPWINIMDAINQKKLAW